MYIFKNKWRLLFSFVLTFLFVSTTLIVATSKVENNIFLGNYKKDTLDMKDDSIDSISLGESKEFNVYNTQTPPELTFIVSYDYIDKTLNGDGTITYELDYSLTNKINTNPTSILYINIYEIQSDGTSIKNDSLSESIDFSLAVNETFNDGITFTLDEDVDVAVSTAVQYSGSPYESGLVYLFSKDRPIIENQSINEDFNLNEYYLYFDYSGDLDLIDDIKFYNENVLLVEDIDYEVISSESSYSWVNGIKFLNTTPNTIYNQYEVEINYHTNFPNDNRIDRYTISPFGTSPDDLNNLINISANNATKDSVDLQAQANLSGIETITLKNIEIFDGSNSLNSYDLSLSNENQTYNDSISTLESNTTYDLDAVITYETISGANTEVLVDINQFNTLPIDPEIQSFNLEDVSSTTASLSWEINDSDLVVKNIEVKDIDLNSIIYNGLETSNEILVENLESLTTYNYQLNVTYQDLNNTEYSVSQDLQFKTTPIEPNLALDNSFINVLDQNNVELTWKFNDENSILNNVQIIDKFDESVIYEDDNSDGNNNYDYEDYLISDLNSNTTYNYQIKYSWSYTDLDSEEISDSSYIDFSFTTLASNPEIVDFLVSDKTETSMELSWNITDNDNVIDSIEILDESNNLIYSPTSKTGSYNIQDLNKGQEYNFKLQVKWTPLNEEQSNEVIESVVTERTFDNTINIGDVTAESIDDNYDILIDINLGRDLTINWGSVVINNDVDNSIDITDQLNMIDGEGQINLTINKDSITSLEDNNIEITINYTDSYGNTDEFTISKIIPSTSDEIPIYRNLWFWLVVLISLLVILLLAYLISKIFIKKNN